MFSSLLLQAAQHLQPRVREPGGAGVLFPAAGGAHHLLPPGPGIAQPGGPGAAQGGRGGGLGAGTAGFPSLKGYHSLICI